MNREQQQIEDIKIVLKYLWDQVSASYDEGINWGMPRAVYEAKERILNRGEENDWREEVNE